MCFILCKFKQSLKLQSNCNALTTENQAFVSVPLICARRAWNHFLPCNHHQDKSFSKMRLKIPSTCKYEGLLARSAKHKSYL